MNAEFIIGLMDTHLKEKDFFLVEVKVDEANRIKVEIDSMRGVNIQDCVELSRLIEKSLDRETIDFELQVSSPGMDQPFRVHQQYVKNNGRDVEVVLKSGEKEKGKLIEVNEDSFQLEQKTKEKVEGKKKKQVVTRVKTIPYNEVISTKQVIKFK